MRAKTFLSSLVAALEDRRKKRIIAQGGRPVACLLLVVFAPKKRIDA
jgi:hypothetical protein